MVFVDLPPESFAGPAPIPSPRSDRAPLSPQRGYRRDRVLPQLANPFLVGESAGLLEQLSVNIHKALQPRTGWQD